MAWKFTYELLSLQANSSDPLPPPYIVKIEHFHPVLTGSLRNHLDLFASMSFLSLIDTIAGTMGKCMPHGGGRVWAAWRLVPQQS